MRRTVQCSVQCAVSGTSRIRPSPRSFRSFSNPRVTVWVNSLYASGRTSSNTFFMRCVSLRSNSTFPESAAVPERSSASKAAGTCMVLSAKQCNVRHPLRPTTPVLMWTCAGGFGWMEECTCEGRTPIWCCCATKTRSSSARSFLLPLLAVLPACLEMW